MWCHEFTRRSVCLKLVRTVWLDFESTQPIYSAPQACPTLIERGSTYFNPLSIGGRDSSHNSRVFTFFDL